MSDTTGIEWTDHTFNPWWGCTRVSPACEHCYAETWAKRFGVQWGVKAERRTASESVWAGPVRWNKAAERDRVRRRVFCASMADVFEDRRDLDASRARLIGLIERTPHLDWQLLTKRPEAVMRLMSTHWRSLGFPPNVWIGTTVEDQRRADERIPHLLKIPARVRFLSCEPLLGPIDLSRWIGSLDWVIGGGESGPDARPWHLGWARDLRDQCAEASVPFFWKQHGEWAPGNDGPGGDILPIAKGCKASGFWTYAGHWNEEPGHEGLNPFRQTMVRVGKKAAGKLLDGHDHKAFPAVLR